MEFVKLCTEDKISRLTICRPDRLNAIGTRVAQELCQAIDQIRAASSQVVVVAAQHVERSDQTVWIAGGDLRELAELDSRGAREYITNCQKFIDGLDALPQLVVTKIDGAAIGGGAELAIAGDLRLAAAHSTLEFKQLKVGLPVGYGSCKRLIDLVGYGRAQSLIYGTESVSAANALAMNLISGIYTSDSEFEVQISNLLKLDPVAIKQQKAMFTRHRRSESEADFFVVAWQNPSHKAFLDRFLQKSK